MNATIYENLLVTIALTVYYDLEEDDEPTSIPETTTSTSTEEGSE